MIGALETILSRPRTVLTLLAVMLLAGIAAFVTVPKEANPNIDVPVFAVSVTQQGVSPEDSLRLLAQPLETKLRGLDGVKELSTVAGEGYAAVILEFDISFDKDEALADVRDKVDQAKAEFPTDADEPVIAETSFSLIPTIVVALSGDLPERALYQHARRLKDRIEAIPSVLEANLTGHREEVFEVIIDTSKLESYNISLDELARSVSRNNQLVPAGAFDQGNGSFNVKVPGLFETAEDIYSLPVAAVGDAVVTLQDIATIQRTFKDPTGFTRFNGKPTIAINVVKRIGKNIIENNNEVRKVVDNFTSDWPEAIKVDFTLDQSSFIHEVLGSLQAAILTAIVLVMVVVVAALGIRSSLLVGLAIPTSFMIGFLLVGLFGMTVNMMVMFGLVLTVGMLVDGAIVIVEYADRKMAEGMHRKEAYNLAAKRMFWPVVSSTATTLAAFLPMLLWPGVPGEFMSYLPIIVIIVLSSSLLTAMVFLPVVGGLIGATTADKKQLEAAAGLAGNSTFDYNKLTGFTGVYIRSLQKIVRMPFTVALIAIMITVGVFNLFGKFNNGVEFFVNEEPEQALALVTARGNLSASEKRDLVTEVEDIVLNVEGVKNTFVTIGSSSSSGAVDLSAGGGQDQPADMIGKFILELEDYCCRPRAAEIFDEIRQRTRSLAGINVEVRKVEGGPQSGKDIRLELTANDYETVKAQTARVRQFVDSMEGLQDVEDGRPLPGIEWQIKIDREEAGRFGTDIVTVGSMFQLVTEGLLIGTTRPDNSEDEIDIRVRLPESERSIDRLDQLRVRTPLGLVPVANMTERTAKPRVNVISRQNGFYSMMVKANTQDGVLPNDKVQELEKWLETQQFPSGVNYRFRGADEEQKESGEFLGKAMLGSLFLMFIILVTQFNSFYQTFLTLSTVVLSIVGVLIGMMITGQAFSIIMTGTGIVALAGIVVNNAIVLIDTFNRLRQSGIETIDAILRACAQRLRPVMLTTITTILGLIPMAMQFTFDFINREVLIGGITSIWWVQLSTAIIFGLAFSTLLTLILVPTMIAAPTVYRERFYMVTDYLRSIGRKEPIEEKLHKPEEIPVLPERSKASAEEFDEPKRLPNKEIKKVARKTQKLRSKKLETIVDNDSEEIDLDTTEKPKRKSVRRRKTYPDAAE